MQFLKGTWYLAVEIFTSRNFWTMVLYTLPVVAIFLIAMAHTKGDMVSFVLGIAYVHALDIAGDLGMTRNERRAAKKEAAEKKPFSVDFSGK